MKNQTKVALVSDEAFLGGTRARESFATPDSRFSVIPFSPDEVWTKDADLAWITGVSEGDVAARCVDTAYRNRLPSYIGWNFISSVDQAFYDRLRNIFAHYYSERDLAERLAYAFEWRKSAIAAFSDPDSEFREEWATARHMVSKAQGIVFACQAQYQAFINLGLGQAEFFWTGPAEFADLRASANPDLFLNAHGMRNFLLAAAPFSSRNNQAFLANALKDAGIPVVFAGKVADREYYELVKSFASPSMLFLPDLDEEMLASAYACAHAFSLPVVDPRLPAETFLAARFGLVPVIPVNCGFEEYLGQDAIYCDPAVPGAYLAGIERAMKMRRTSDVKMKAVQEPEVTRRAHWHFLTELPERDPGATSVPDGVTDIYVDLTSLSRCAFINGVPRVEINYARSLLDLHGDRVKLVMWDEGSKRFLRIADRQLQDLSFMRISRNSKNAPGRGEEISFIRGAIYFIPGNIYLYDSQYARAIYNIAEARNLKLVIFIHDMIKRKFLHWHDVKFESMLDNFSFLNHIVQFYICNSQSTINDIYEFNNRRGFPTPLCVKVRLGDEIGYAASPEFNAGRISALIRGRPYILFVSGFEYRKNHELVYRVYRKLMENDGVAIPLLVCVGADQGKYPTGEMLQHDPDIASHVLVLHDVDEAELDWLYRNCLFTLYPSLYEGWGLPVAESLLYGKPCLSSNASSMPEIAPEQTILLDPKDTMAWHDAILRLIRDPAELRKWESIACSYAAYGWKESGEALSATLTGQRFLPETWPSLPFERPVPTWEANKTFNYSCRILTAGWGAPERDGTWTVERNASMIFMARADVLPAALEITASAYMPADYPPQEVTIFSNGRYAGTLVVGNAYAPYSFPLVNPGQVEEGFVQYKLELVIGEPRVPKLINSGSRDQRKLGIRVKTIRLVRATREQAELAHVHEAMAAIVRNGAELFGSLLARRPDLVALSDDAKMLPSALLLWAWSHGREESAEIRSAEAQLASALRAMYSEEVKGARVPGYTALMQAIWETRPDLRIFDIATESGQEQMKEWFHANGIAEYGLGIDELGLSL